MIDADLRQGDQSVMQAGQLFGVDIKFGMPADQLKDPPRHPVQIFDALGTAALQIKTHCAHASLVQLNQFFIGDAQR